MIEDRSKDDKERALRKRWRTAVRWSWRERVINALIIAGFVGAVFLGYARYFWSFVISMIVVFFLAARRFFGAQNLIEAASGEIQPPDYSEYDHLSSDSESFDTTEH